MKRQIVYARNGNRVERVGGTLIVRASNGCIADRYSIADVERAIELADELTASDAVILKAA